MSGANMSMNLESDNYIEEMIFKFEEEIELHKIVTRIQKKLDDGTFLKEFNTDKNMDKCDKKI